MKLSRRISLWLADRHPAFDRPGLYRRPNGGQVVRDDVTATGWDAVLIGMASLVLVLVGMGGLLLCLFLATVIVATWFG